MAKFMRHSSCPSCGSRDNLARYEDGSAWCFGCHYYEPPSHLERGRPDFEAHTRDPERVRVSRDVFQRADGVIPEEAVNWLKKYDISVVEAIQRGAKYYAPFNQLIFPLYDEEHQFVGYQARNFDPERKLKGKYYNAVERGAAFPKYGSFGYRVVVVEDLISAYRVSRMSDSFCCLGSSLGLDKIIALRASYEVLDVWLDGDKWREARQISEQAKLIGFSSMAIYTEKDPKEYTDIEIKEILT